MVQGLRHTRLKVIGELTQRLAGESVGGFWGECLDAALAGTSAKAALAFELDGHLELVAERRLGAVERPLPPLLRGAEAFAGRSLATRKSYKSTDLRVDRDGVDDAGEFLALGIGCVLALPVLDRRTPIGAMLLLFTDSSEADSEVMSFATTIASLAALRAPRDRKAEPEASSEQQEEVARMFSLGLLTATVAHELRGPAGALLLQQEELKRLIEQLELLDTDHDAASTEVLTELTEVSTDIGTAVARVRETVEQLSMVSRRELSPEHVELSEVVDESLTIAKPHFARRGIILTKTFDPGCYTIARRDNLSQVVLNLVFNAMDACERAAQPEVAVRVEAVGDHVALVVEDNGPGVPTAAIPHIFKPFYTTKPRGDGTGLGLKICSDVVSAHGGHIEVHERAGGGASFRVLLPRTREDSGLLALPITTVPRAATSTRRKQVLVVDDDPVFSRTIRRSLKPHDVRTCAAASEAQALLLETPYTPDLVLCDVFLPGANGNLLHSRVAKHRPEIARRFVFVTGGALGKEEAAYLRNSGCNTLFKPVELKSLLDLLSDPLTESGAPPNTVKTLQQAPPSSSNRSPSLP